MQSPKLRLNTSPNTTAYSPHYSDDASFGDYHVSLASESSNRATSPIWIARVNPTSEDSIPFAQIERFKSDASEDEMLHDTFSSTEDSNPDPISLGSKMLTVTFLFLASYAYFKIN